MQTIDLILLGSVYQGPKSPYELQKQIDERNLSRWVKIGSYTVYKKVVQYETKGFVTGKTERNGNMPEKTVYTITEKGRAHFKMLMNDLAKEQTRIFLDFNAVIVNLALLEGEEREKCVESIRNSISDTKIQLSESLTEHENIPLYGKTILKQQYMILETLEKWERDFENELAEGEAKNGND